MAVDLATQSALQRPPVTDQTVDERSVPVRRAASVAACVALVAGLAAGVPTLVLVGLVLTTTSLLMRRLAGDLALPCAVLLLLALSTVTGVAAGLLGLDLLIVPWALATGYLCYAVAGVWWSGRQGGLRLSTPAPRVRHGWVAYAGAGVAALIGLGQGLFERMAASWAFVATDLAQHMTLLSDVQKSGSLDYSSSSYPRAFHMLVALASVPSRPTDPADLLGYDMRLVCAATWLSLGLVLWVWAAVCLRLGAARGASPLITVGGAAACGVGALLSNTLIRGFVYMGAAPSLLAVVVMVSLPLLALSLRKAPRVPASIAALAITDVMLLAHLWQTLAVVPIAALAAYVTPRVRPALVRAVRRRGLGSARAAVPLALFALVALGVAAVPALSIQHAGGVGLAAQAGTLATAPWTVVALGLLAVLALAGDVRRGWARLYLGSVGGLLVGLAVMLRGAGHGLDLTQYYPMKVVWFLALVLAPVVALVTSQLGCAAARPVWRSMARLGLLARLGRFAFAAVLATLAFAFWLPFLLGVDSATVGTLQTHSIAHPADEPPSFAGSSSERFDLARQYGTRYGARRTVPVAVGIGVGFNSNGPYVLSKLISFQTGQPQNFGQVATACDDVRMVTGGTYRAVVITEITPALLRPELEKQGCGAVRVVQVSGAGSVSPGPGAPRR